MFRLVCCIVSVAVFTTACGAEDPQTQGENGEMTPALNALVPGPCMHTDALDGHQVHYEYDIDDQGRVTAQRRYTSLTDYDMYESVYYFDGPYPTGQCFSEPEQGECERWVVDAEGVPQSGTRSENQVDMFMEGIIEFDENGRRVRDTLYIEGESADAPLETRTYVYEGNTVRVVSESAEGTYEITRTFDDEGRLIQDGERTFEYDAAGRLVVETDSISTTTHTYDAHGNRLTTRRIDSDGAVQADLTYSFGCFLDDQINPKNWVREMF